MAPQEELNQTVGLISEIDSWTPWPESTGLSGCFIFPVTDQALGKLNGAMDFKNHIESNRWWDL